MPSIADVFVRVLSETSNFANVSNAPSARSTGTPTKPENGGARNRPGACPASITSTSKPTPQRRRLRSTHWSARSEIEDRTPDVDVDVDVDPNQLGRAATQISSSLMEAANAGTAAMSTTVFNARYNSRQKRCHAHRHQLPRRRAGRTGRCRRSSHRSARPATGCPHRGARPSAAGPGVCAVRPRRR